MTDKKLGRVANQNNYQSNQFVKGLDLTAVDKPFIHEYADNPLDLFMRLTDIVEAGYKLGISWSDKMSCYCATLTPTGKDSVNAGYVLSGMGKTPILALACVCYKHVVLCEKGVWPKGKKEEDDGLR